MLVFFVSKKIIFRISVGLGMLFCSTVLIIFIFQVSKTQGPLGKLTVVIDPGHGGIDGGTADWWGNLEKNINLAVGLKIKNQLRQSGLRVVLTRDRDTDLAPFLSGRTGRHRRDLLGRIKKAAAAGCLFLVSIHCNWSEDSRKQGAMVFYNHHSTASRQIAELIQEELNLVQEKPGKIAPGKYFIIRQREITGVLVELGFLSNRGDAAKLQDEGYQEILGEALARGILRYCRKTLGYSE